jgi:alkyl sulfatase BDS1-like metallo-beta-lactamase superfamily hydrolase
VAHSAEFKQEIVRVTDGVYVAVGYGIANSVLIEGEDGVIIVDTLESVEAATPVRAEFDKITTKPVRAIIYTHHHEDHIFGATVFAANAKPAIIAHERLMGQVQRSASVVRETTFRRAAHQFGNLLPSEMVVNVGIGPFLRVNDSTHFGFIAPTQTFSGESTTLEIAGVRMELRLAPGETDDQIIVWLPTQRVLLAADNIYKSFPNLYAIRGTPYRNVASWVQSLDQMRAYRPDYLVLGHGRPLAGATHICETLTAYRDAIQYVHDQTIRGINRGLTPDALVETVKLPPHLASHPYLQEYYGSVAWSVRAIYDGYLGWFDGNATHLFPLTPRERAARVAELAGGESALRERARQAISQQDYQWGLELLDHVLALYPNDKDARALKAQALTALAEQQPRATARNYYLTQAMVETGALSIQFKLQAKDKELLRHLPLSAIFAAMAVKLDPVKSEIGRAHV